MANSLTKPTPFLLSQSVKPQKESSPTCTARLLGGPEKTVHAQGALAPCSPGSPQPLTQNSPKLSRRRRMHPFRMQDRPGQHFRFPKKRVTSPAVPPPRVMQGAYPTALRARRQHSVPAPDLQTRIRKPATVQLGQGSRRGVAIGTALRTPARNAAGAGKEGSQDLPCPLRPRPVIPSRAAPSGH